MLEKAYDAKNFSLLNGVLEEDAIQSSSRDFRLKIRLPKLLPWRPGQFVMLRWGRHIVGRPFAIVSWEKSGNESVLEVWVRRLGSGSEELFNAGKKNFRIDVTAPLGNGLNLMGKNVLFLSGGVGAASIFPIVKKHLETKSKHLWVHGEQNEGSFDQTWLKAGALLQPHISYFEDQASFGLKGRITSAFEGVVDKRIADNFDAVVACGPSAMLEALVKKNRSLKHLEKTPLWLGLEEKMGCGVGLCFSCSVSTQEGMQRCCLEGPWFEADTLKNHFSFRKTGSV